MNSGVSAGVFTISLDFELYWGVRDKRSLALYHENLANTEGAIHEMLRVFDQYGLHATWATVGMLFCRDRMELQKSFPSKFPIYDDNNLSPYPYIKKTQNLDKQCHFTPELIDLIGATSGQEIGSHTFSHYYCLEAGQGENEFRHDINQAIEVAKGRQIAIQSLVFPRNQYNAEYLSVLKESGIRCYRGNENHWVYRASSSSGQGKIRRALRLLDAYVNITGHHTHALPRRDEDQPCCLAASRFLRPYSRKLSCFDKLRLNRIKRSMTVACRKNEVFHLWWHPHNFGQNTSENVAFLEAVAEHYQCLRDRYGMSSLNMGELSGLCAS